MIQPERVCELNRAPVRGGARYVLYWMQQAQRAEWNHALELAVREANRLNLPVLAAFGLTAAYPDANLRHYTFLLEGLRETADRLLRRGIRLAIFAEPPDALALRLGREAALVVADRGYLRIQKEWRARAAAGLGCRCLQAESDVTVPVDSASDHHEYAAATLRPKLQRLRDAWLQPLADGHVRRDSLGLDVGGITLGERAAMASVLASLPLDRTVPPVPSLRGGRTEALRRLERFLVERLPHYAEARNDPANEFGSGLSAHLHFGQISPLEIALRVRAAAAPAAAREAFLEELLVRRELAMNHVHHTPDYDRYTSIPGWAQRSLERHAGDRRPALYSPADLESARTADPYWNAAQTEMLRSGAMHSYLRMYWGKKILEWSPTPEAAFQTALWLNNRYEVDGRDANGFTGVAWCFGLHDRPWAERPVFGQVRYMNAAGLERKFDMAAYCRRVAALAEAPAGTG
jgi:deoxyribodipyrimidine photo-lyase